MPLLSFFVRRFFMGSVARFLTGKLERHFKMSPATANIVFLILTEVLARGLEKSGRFPSKGLPSKGLPSRGMGRFFKRA